MGGAALVAAGALSLVPFLLEAASGGTLALEGASRAGIVLLVWLALAGIPRRAGVVGEGAGPGGLVAVLACLPAVVLGAALDLRAGLPAAALAAAAGAGLAIAALLAAAARASGVPGARPAYALLWAAFLPGTAALLVALRWAPLPGDAPLPAALDLVASLHPLVWAWGWTRAGGLDAGPPAPLPLASAVALVVVARRRRTVGAEGGGAA